MLTAPTPTDSLSGRVLDTMVAVALGHVIRIREDQVYLATLNGTADENRDQVCPEYSVNSSETLAFMDSERLQPMYQLNGEGKGRWACSVAGSYSIWAQGETMAQAAARCLVMLKIGTTVQLPVQLREAIST